MIFAQFYHLSVPTEWNQFTRTPIEASGDRAVIVFDARRRLVDVKNESAYEARKRGFCGFAMFRGMSFSNSRQISQYREAKTFSLVGGSAA